MNSAAVNYNPKAQKDDNSCILDVPNDGERGIIKICTDRKATNYEELKEGYESDDSVCQYCGNGTIDDGETCDDSNDIAYDGCSSCQLELCYAEMALCMAKNIPKNGDKSDISRVASTWLP